MQAQYGPAPNPQHGKFEYYRAHSVYKLLLRNGTQRLIVLQPRNYSVPLTDESIERTRGAPSPPAVPAVGIVGADTLSSNTLFAVTQHPADCDV